MILHLEPLLMKYKVNLAFYGHNHVVQRHAAVYNKTVVQLAVKRVEDNKTIWWHENPQATVHMVVGTGGAGFTVNAVDPKPVWNELYFYEYGYARVTALSAERMDWEWINSSTSEVIVHSTHC